MIATGAGRWAPAATQFHRYENRTKISTDRRGSLGSVSCILHSRLQGGWLENLTLAERRLLPMGSLLVDREHDGMGGRIDIKPDHIAQFLDELGIGGELELPHAMRLQPVRSPDALHRTDADPALFCHHGCGPVRGFTGRIAERQGDSAFGHLPPNGAIRDRRVLSRNKPSKPSSMKRCCQRQTQVLDLPVCCGRDGERDSSAHAPESHAPTNSGIPLGFKCQILSTSVMRFNRLSRSLLRRQTEA
jgi:hypothetical protein